MSYLDSTRLNLSMLKEIARTDLFTLLDSIDGSKAIVWDPKLISPIGLISDYSDLKLHEVVQMLELRAGKLPSINAQNLIYFIRPILASIEVIADQIKTENSKKSTINFNFHLVFLPRKCILCEKKLESLGVFGDLISVNQFSPDFYVLDTDLISIEWPSSFREYRLESDYSSLYQLATSLLNLQCVFGIIPSVCGVGRFSKKLIEIFNKMRGEMSGIETQVISTIDQLIILDRSVDLLTPAVFQLTYEGLLDEIYGINQTVIKLPSAKFRTNSESSNNAKDGLSQFEASTELKRFHLNSNDELFKRIRDLFYLSIGPVLHQSAKSLAARFDERRTAKTVREIKQFVEKIPYLQKLRTLQSNHTSMAELIREFTDCEEFHEKLSCENQFFNCIDLDLINPYIESCINRSKDLITVLRLIIIQSFCANGLKQKTLDHYKREILQTYGYEHLLTLADLEKSGLIRLSNGYGLSYSGCRTRFKLTRDSKSSQQSQQKEDNNDTIGKHLYVHDVYTPFTSRLVQHIDQFGFRSLTETLARQIKSDPNSPNPFVTFEEIYPIGNNRRRRNSDCNSIQSSSECNEKTVLVLFVGGCTYSEISSLRLLSQKEDIHSDFIIATTSIINGKSLIQSIMNQNLAMRID
ncbi:Vacuolar protein sorting-associated protein 33A [Sarcoptes scabiei]|uniref:Vacuolar protein sorting-associated protein 33A n=1 Tax=Sarcoptes scabiei TaxID=52283 RepID=A0A834VA18_SARSC|nr:Vacuolar protein sorting-associated protein 33A [Sarcoptes scabiei]